MNKYVEKFMRKGYNPSPSKIMISSNPPEYVNGFDNEYTSDEVQFAEACLQWEHEQHISSTMEFVKMVDSIPDGLSLLEAAAYVRYQSVQAEQKKQNEERKNVKLLNALIEAAIIHGGDSGGPYGSNREELRRAIREYADAVGLNKYEIVEEQSCVFRIDTNLTNGIEI